MKIIEKKSRAFYIVLLLILALPAFSKLLKPGYFPMHDDMQAMRLLQLDKCVSDWQIPCRWVPDMGYGYGYPQFNYYSPLPYYSMEAFHLIGFSYLDSVKAFFVLSVVLSAIGMYLLGEALWGKVGGFISSLIYIYAPYRAVDMYVRGAVGEIAAFAILPFIFLYSKQVVDGNKKAILGLAVSLATLFTSHNITTLILVPFLILWVIVLVFTNKKDFPTSYSQLKNFVFSFIWGFLISAFFLLPAWFEKRYVHVETLLVGYFNYINHFVGINQLLFQTQWGYGTSEVGPYDDLLLGVGILQWVLPIVAVTLLYILKKTKAARMTFFLTLMGWFALFMIHPRSQFLWDRIHLLAFVQFPWRFLLVATFLFSMVAGAFAKLFPRRNNTTITLLIFFVMVVLFINASYFTPRIWINTTDSEKFSGSEWQRQQTISIYDYLPIYADKPPASVAPDKPEVSDGEVQIVNGSKGSNWQKWKLTVASPTAVIQLPIFYFPTWVVFVDGKEESFTYDNNLGLITLNLPEGNHALEAKLTDTPLRTFSNLLSLSGLIAVPVFIKKKKYL